jgi:hypothetical protein
METYIYPGNIHIHSLYSDGTGNVAEIATAAASAGLSYVVITDHENMDGKAEEGFIDGVATLVGMEINRPYSHYLALNLEKPLPSNPDNPQAVIDQVRQANGLGFLAHPFEIGSPYVEKGTAYPWKYWPVFNFDGMEIWNFSSHWRGCGPSLFRALYYFFINRKGAMTGPPADSLKLWDCYNLNGHRVVGIGSSDAHAFKYRLGPFNIILFEYEYCFGTINTYLVMKEQLSADFTTAKKQIYSSLRSGNCYLAYDSLNSGNGFHYTAQLPDEEEPQLMGEWLTYRPGVTLQVKAPAGRPLIRMIRNGRLVAVTAEDSFSYKPAEPGLYRVEVYHRSLLGKPRPWIYSNPIFLSK